MPEHNNDNPKTPQPPTILDPLPRADTLPAHNRLPARVRESIAAMVIQEGRPLTAVAEAFNIHRHTVAEVIREYAGEYFDLRNLQLAGRLDSVTEALLERLHNSIDDIPVGQLAVSMGIALDKRAALIGKMTSEKAPLRLRISWKDGSGAVELTAAPGGSPGPGDPSPVFRVHDSRDTGPEPGDNF